MSHLYTEVNPDNKVVGAREKEEFLGTGRIHRTAALLILSSEGEVLLQKRKKGVSLYPLLFDFPASCWLEKDESFDTGVARAMRDTLGLDVHCVEAFSFLSPEGDERGYVTVYTTYSEGPFRLLSEELDTVEWMSESWLREELDRRPDKFTPAFHTGIKMYYDRFASTHDMLSTIE